VLFNEPKLLKYQYRPICSSTSTCFSALQRAEIAEIVEELALGLANVGFQCSSTSRNC